MEDDEKQFIRPRTVNTVEYVRTRIDQIAELLQVVDNPALGMGEVASGPRTVFQRLPRHMRRRAMSHNIKRLPRILRPLAIRNVSKTQHSKKTPSRLWRRRPSRLLKQRIRVQKKSVWLSTHIWHAKRFHICNLWGFKVPFRSFQKNFRPNYRSSINSAVIIDRSYLCCLQFLVSDQNRKLLIDMLSKFCQKEVSPTFSNARAVCGDAEMPVMLFTPSEYPRGFIGPARFSCAAPTRFNLWIHPSTTADVLENFSMLESVEIIRRNNLKNENREESSKPIKLFNLSNEFGRFQLFGQHSLAYFHYVLKLASDEELTSLALLPAYKEIHQWWRGNAQGILTGNVRPGTQIPLLVEDPRLFRAQGRQRQQDLEPKQKKTCAFECNHLPPAAPNHLFWDWQQFKTTLLPKRLSNAEFEHFCTEKLTFPQKTEFKVPILLVFRGFPPDGCRNSKADCGVDFICPSSVSYDFWLAFHYANIRPIALKDKMFLDLERGLFTFPDDCPDSTAGRKQNEAEADAFREKQLRCPKKKGIQEKCSLVDWDMFGSKVPRPNLYILRDRLKLKHLDNWLRDRNVQQIDSCHNIIAEQCLVPVSLKFLSKGVPKRFALICLPDRENIGLSNSKRKLDNSSAEVVAIHEGIEERPNHNKIPEYLHLSEDRTDFHIPSEGSINKLVYPNQFFPPENFKLAKNRKKRPKILQQPKIPSLGEQASQSNNSRVIGRVIRGDYSFVNARGIAFGFVHMEALSSIGKDGIVLIKNITNKTHYYEAQIAVNHFQTDI